MEKAIEFIQTKLKVEHRVLWETLAVKKKRKNTKTASLRDKTDPTKAKAQKLTKEQYELINACQI